MRTQSTFTLMHSSGESASTSHPRTLLKEGPTESPTESSPPLSVVLPSSAAPLLLCINQSNAAIVHKEHKINIQMNFPRVTLMHSRSESKCKCAFT